MMIRIDAFPRIKHVVTVQQAIRNSMNPLIEPGFIPSTAPHLLLFVDLGVSLCDQIVAPLDIMGTISTEVPINFGVQMMKGLVVYVSISHGNTEKAAKAISEVLGADLKDAKDIDLSMISNYDIIGFGSGIFHNEFHTQHRILVSEMPTGSTRMFIFSTSGFGTTDFHTKKKKVVEDRGYHTVSDPPAKVGIPGPRSNRSAG